MQEKRNQLLAIALAFVIGIVSAASMVMLDEDDPDGDGDAKQENNAPVASMYASATEIYLDDSSTFDAAQSSDVDGSITAYYFDFGDGSDTGWLSAAGDEVQEHTYTAIGEYTAFLKVKDNGDENGKDGKNILESTNTMEIDIIVIEEPLPENMPPVAFMYASATEIYPGDSVVFDVSKSYDPDGELTKFHLEFGSGGKTEWLAGGAETQEHTYNSLGNYTALLKVTDDGGLDGSDPLDSEVMEIVISVIERPPIEEQIEPSERSMVDFEEAFQAVDSSPLSEQQDLPEPEIDDLGEAMQNFDVSQDVNLTNGTGDPPQAGEFDMETDMEMDTEVRDLEEANAGLDASMEGDGLPDDLVDSMEGHDIGTEILDDLEGQGGALEEFEMERSVLDDLSGNSADVFQENYVNDSFGEDDDDEAKSFSYRATTALNITAKDGDGDGNAEFVYSFTLAYEAMGDEENPTYESFYSAELTIFDNDSDGNANYFRLNEFGFESYDGNGDGIPEFSLVHVRTVVFYDNDSDGNAEYAHALEVNFVNVDVDSNGVSEFQAAHFAEMRLFDLDSDGNPGSIKLARWGFKSLDADNDSNPEYAAIYGETIRVFDNDSSGNPGYASYTLFGYGYVDGDDDGEKDLEVVVFKQWSAWDRKDSDNQSVSDGNPETIRGMEIFYVHGSESNFSMATARAIELYDNGSDGAFNYAHFTEWSYAAMDSDDDGNKELEIVRISDFEVYNNDTSNEAPSYVKAYSISALKWDSDDDGEPEGEYFSIEMYVHIDENEDGEPEETYYLKYEGDGSEG